MRAAVGVFSGVAAFHHRRCAGNAQHPGFPLPPLHCVAFVALVAHGGLRAGRRSVMTVALEGVATALHSFDNL